jgi:DNA-binding LytR/AlgR family response regulator
MKLRCIVIDDEPLARKGLREYIEDTDFLSIQGEFQNALDAADFLKRTSIDLLFLDIRMPKLSGIDFLKKLENPPLVIFTTAYTEYAIESYELNVIDYLLKPISTERFKKASQKALDYFTLQKKSNPTVDYFFIKANQKIEKIFFNEILYVEAMQNYCIIHTQDKKLITYSTLTAMNEKLPAEKFMKAHKSFVVAINKVNAVAGNELLIGPAKIPISRTIKDEVLKKIVGKLK